jgi:hypothetical protein
LSVLQLARRQALISAGLCYNAHPRSNNAKKSHGDHKNRSEKDKQKKKKLPVQPADLGKSARIQMVEQLQADMATMQDKYAQLEKRSSSDAHTSTINNVLIPKLKGEVGQSGKNGHKQGYNLQISMGLKSKKVLYNKVRVSNVLLDI